MRKGYVVDKLKKIRGEVDNFYFPDLCNIEQLKGVIRVCLDALEQYGD